MGFWWSFLNVVLTVVRSPILAAVCAVVPPMIGVFATLVLALGSLLAQLVFW